MINISKLTLIIWNLTSLPVLLTLNFTGAIGLSLLLLEMITLSTLLLLSASLVTPSLIGRLWGLGCKK